MTRKTRRHLFWFSVLTFIIIAPPIILYSTGWRLTEDLKIKRIGGLFVAVPESGTDVYLDGELERRTKFFQSGVFIQNLTPGDYAALLAKEGFWPWIKQLPVVESSVVEARALMLPQVITGKIVPEDSSEYETVAAFFETIETATSSDGMHGITLDRRKRARIWFDDSQKIWAEWLSDSPLPYYLTEQKEIIFVARSSIKHISFFPKRDDIVLLAIENGVFALEIDGRGTRNFQPVYKGVDPTFIRIENNIYILDQDVISKIEL